jgi:lipopolysaccharide assembly protein A
MRWIRIAIFLVFLGLVLVFAIQNTQPLTVHFLNANVTAPVALLALTIYVLGMVSGWSVVAYLKLILNSIQ